MDQTGFPRTERLTIAPPSQIRPHERSSALMFALAFFAIWSVPFWGPVLVPATLAYIVLAYDVYWTFQALYGTWAGIRSYGRLQQWRKVDWLARYTGWGKTVQQIVVIPNFAERIDTLAATLERLANSAYPREHLSVLLAMEEREPGALEKAEALRGRFAGSFGHFWITVHTLLPGETPCKGTNLNYAARQSRRFCDDLGWDPAHVVVTTVDADTRLHPQYLAALAVQFLTVEQPTRKFFQGILMLTNNIWDVHAPIRALSSFWTFTYMAAVSHYQRITTAVYSMSLRLLDDARYWDTRAPVEDGRVYFRAFFALGGKVDVCPIYLPIGLDAVGERSLWSALRVQFRQMSRWAWTASNLPFLAYMWPRHPEITWRRKFQKCFPYVESLLVIPISWFVITFGGIVPSLINPAMQTYVFDWPLAVVSPLILSPTVLGVICGLAINIRLRAQYAQRPRPVSRLYRILQWGEWLLLPLVGVFYFSIPYVQAYLRLLTGNDLEYKRTPK